MTSTTVDLHKLEREAVVSALLAGQSVLLLGEPGAGKSTLGLQVQEALTSQGYSVAIANYGGSAKETLISICEQLDLPTESQPDPDKKPRPMTAEQLRKELLSNLPLGQRLLVVDDAHRWPASLRYWLEDCYRASALLLLLATNPPKKEIFLKLCRIEMQSVGNDEIRTLMYSEAIAHGMTLNPSQFAELQQRAGNNPALAKRVVHEAKLGISEAASGDHHQYIDGTPFLIAALTAVGILRLIGLGMGDKSLYILGGLATIGAIALRTIYFAANKRTTRTRL